MRIRHRRTRRDEQALAGTITFTVETNDGQRWRLAPMDLSLNTAQTVNFPAYYITGDHEDMHYVSLFAELNYNSRDRS